MRHALLLCLLLLVATQLRAQTLPGLRIGTGMGKINGISSTRGSYHWQQYQHGGLILSHKIGDQLYVQPEVLYSQKGYKYQVQRTNRSVFRDTVNYEEKNQINFLDTPILLRYGAKGFYAEAGPQFSFLLSGERTETRTTQTNGASAKHTTTRNLNSMVENVDIGFVGGFGYQSVSGLGLSARFNQSFKDVIQDKENWKKLVVLQVSAFYLLGKHKEIKNTPPPVPPVIDAPDVEYYDKRKISTKGYRIVSKLNVNRVTFTKVADSKQMQVEYKIISTGVFSPQDVQLAGSSGAIENGGIFMRHREVAFPFQGSIQFTVPATAGTNAPMMSRMEYEIKEPGHWRITITVSR